jgi:hypothetical protein
MTNKEQKMREIFALRGGLRRSQDSVDADRITLYLMWMPEIARAMISR